MSQPYFILVLAHSMHGRLRRIHIPHQVLYGVLALALVGLITLLGITASYARMALKVSNYNALRAEVEALRDRYQRLQSEANEQQQQMATLQLFASEVSNAYGLRRSIQGPTDLTSEGRLVPTVAESVAEYNYLRNVNFTKFYRRSLRSLADSRPSLWPVEGRLMSHFGMRSDPFSGEGAFHAGVDISAELGTPVRATADGVVTRVGWESGYGKLVVVEHGNGFETYYAHLSRFDVMEGMEVRRGTIVGRSGSSGRSTGAHLHYEVRMNGTAVNPHRYLQHTSMASLNSKRDFPF